MPVILVDINENRQSDYILWYFWIRKQINSRAPEALWNNTCVTFLDQETSTKLILLRSSFVIINASWIINEVIFMLCIYEDINIEKFRFWQFLICHNARLRFGLDYKASHKFKLQLGPYIWVTNIYKTKFCTLLIWFFPNKCKLINISTEILSSITHWLSLKFN